MPHDALQAQVNPLPPTQNLPALPELGDFTALISALNQENSADRNSLVKNKHK